MKLPHLKKQRSGGKFFEFAPPKPTFQLRGGQIPTFQNLGVVLLRKKLGGRLWSGASSSKKFRESA